MSLVVAIVVGISIAVGIASFAMALLDAVGVAMSAWFDQREDDL